MGYGGLIPAEEQARPPVGRVYPLVKQPGSLLSGFHPNVTGSRRLGQATDPSITVAQFYYDLIIPLLSASCEAQGVTSQECAAFQFRLTQCQEKLNQAIVSGNVIEMATAAWCMKELHEDIQQAFKPEEPPPAPPVPIPPKPQTEFVIPWWAYLLGGVGVIGLGVGIYAVAKK